MYRERNGYRRDDDGLLAALDWLLWIPFEFGYYLITFVVALIKASVQAVVEITS